MPLITSFFPASVQLDEGVNIQDDSQTWIPLEVFNLYRTAIAAILNIIFLLASIPELKEMVGVFPRYVPAFVSITLYAYLGFSLLCHFFTKIRKPDYRIQALLQILVDILVFTLLMQSAHGLSTGLSTLLIIVVGAGAALLPKKLALLCASIATISVLLDQIFQQLFVGIYATNYPQAGAVGIVFFATAIIIHSLSHKISANASIIFENQLAVRRLQRLNNQVMERVKIGALVVDDDNRVSLANAAAIKMLKTERAAVEQGDINTLSPQLGIKISLWKAQEKMNFSPFPLTEKGKVVVITLYSLGEAYRGSTLIFIEDLSEHLKEAQEMKLATVGRLTATIAHEIRNPLMAISHSAQLLLEANDLKEEERHLLHIIEDNTKRANIVTENILMLSRAKPAMPVNIELLPWLKALVAEYSAAKPDPVDVTLEIPSDLTIFFDTEQLRQVMVNLMENGLRYSLQETGKEQLLIRGSRHPSDKTALIDIIDYGPGVAPELEFVIFEPFFTTDHKGTGLGLFVVKSLCEANHAQIFYQPQIEGRSCFRLILPTEETEGLLVEDAT